MPIATFRTPDIATAQANLGVCPEILHVKTRGVIRVPNAEIPKKETPAFTVYPPAKGPLWRLDNVTDVWC